MKSYAEKPAAGPGFAVLVVAIALASMTIAGVARGHDAHPPASADPAAMTGRAYTRHSTAYTVPGVTLRDYDGKDVRLDHLLADGGPVLLQFIFTSCTTICPVMSATFAQAQGDLIKLDASTRLISVSIDPEYDTPARLRDYARRHGAGANWTFLTGSSRDIFRTVKAFDALYASDNKMYHQPYTYLRRSPGAKWLRLTGMPSAGELLAEYRGVLAASQGSAVE